MLQGLFKSCRHIDEGRVNDYIYALLVSARIAEQAYGPSMGNCQALLFYRYTRCKGKASEEVISLLHLL